MPNKWHNNFWTKEAPTDKTSGAKGQGKAKQIKNTYANNPSFKGGEWSSTEGEVERKEGLQKPKRGGGFLKS